MPGHPSYTLTDKQNGNLAFRLLEFTDDSNFNHIQRLNYYSVIWIKKGAGKLKANFAEYDFSENSLFAFSPYQPFMLTADGHVEGVSLSFHPDFYCIHHHLEEVSCRGVMFNNIYQKPFVMLDDKAKSTLAMLVAQIEAEMKHPTIAQHEALVNYMKLVLIVGSRLKNEQNADEQKIVSASKEPFILQNLKLYIEQHFKTKHSASEYASLLNISAKALAKIAKSHFNKTLSHLINERIIIEAKRELFITNKTIKEIAYELGYEDEFYFSRFFKINTDISPQLYRDTVGYGRGAA
jgi:AraC family transcriptional regulator, transcriptional activator of pobA